MNQKELLLSASAWFPHPNRHYTFEPNTINGNVLTDLSGTQNGTIFGNPAFESGRKGNCVTFDGSSSKYINIGNVDFIHRTGVFCVAFWAKTQYSDSGEYFTLFGNSATRPNAGVNIGFLDTSPNNRALFVAVFDKMPSPNPAVATLTVQNILPADGQYHHYVINADNYNLDAYIDGALVGSAPFTRQMNNTGNALNAYLGALNNLGSPIRNFKGSIDEFRIIPKTLTSQQIKRLYQTGQ